MSRSSFAVRVALGCTVGFTVGCTLLATSLSFVQAHAAPASAPGAPASSTAPLPVSAPALHVAVSTQGNTLTFTPREGVAAVRVQITSNMGNQLYNSGWMSGFDAGLDALTWQALDDKGAPLPDGLYLTLVEVRGVDGMIKSESGSLQLDAASVAPRSDIGPRATTITGAGTANRLALWTSASTIGDSIVTQTSSTALSVAGSLTVTNTITTKTVNATNNTGNALVGNSKSGTALAGITQTGNGVLGTSTSANGVRGVSGTGVGVRGDSNNGTIGVQGNSNASPTSGTAMGVYGSATGSNHSIGVRGDSIEGIGVYGSSNSGDGVSGISNKADGVYGSSNIANGLYGYSSTGTGVYGESSSGNAGYFLGNVVITKNLSVTGTVSKGGGSFRIDDPTDPAHKYLSHSFVESPDMMNIYNGTVTLDNRGHAVVTMPTYFAALNRDFRYQLTPIGAPAPNLYVLREIKNNTFEVAGGKPGLKVSWEVTGIRRDPWANDHRIPTQQLKTGAERGRYLYPAGYHQPASLGIDHLVAKPQTPRRSVQQVSAKPTVKPAVPPRVAQATR